MEDRTECRESGAVSYKRDVANVLALEIDPAAATNKEQLDQYQVTPKRCQHAMQQQTCTAKDSSALPLVCAGSATLSVLPSLLTRSPAVHDVSIHRPARDTPHISLPHAEL